MSDEPQDAQVFSFRIGSRSYSRGIEGPFSSRDEASIAANGWRNRGVVTGRIRRTPSVEMIEAQSKIRTGILPMGW